MKYHPEAAAKAGLPYLEHFPEPGEPPHRIVLEQLPFRIGRSPTANYVIYSRQVSKEHSEIFQLGNELHIRDLGSTNGTFVNGQRVREAPLTSGDIIHVAHKEFRFGAGAAEAEAFATPGFTELADGQLPSSLIRGTMHLRQMLTDQSVRIVFQPIVYLASGQLMGFEALGRGTHASLSPNPSDLFDLAGQCNLAAELSRVFRQAAVEEATRVPAPMRIFLNLHPSEMTHDRLLDSLRKLQAAFQDRQQVVLEVHEGVVTDLATMRWLRGQLKEMGMGLAYDDFGAGQSRLTELTEVPPDFIKLDRSLIHDLDSAPARQDLVRALNRVITDLGVQCIAEGIETPAEAHVCQQLGCLYGQGYLFGRPQPLALLGPDGRATAGPPLASGRGAGADVPCW
jgi:EAL domain-containing protein (putative c-di-GMP-specific phosphodiesterase class I)